MTLGGDYMQAASLDNSGMALLPFGTKRCQSGITGIIQLFDLGFDIAAQYDIGAATGHIGSDGDCTRKSGFDNNIGFTLVLLGVQDIVLNTRFFQHLRE